MGLSHLLQQVLGPIHSFRLLY